MKDANEVCRKCKRAGFHTLDDAAHGATEIVIAELLQGGGTRWRGRHDCFFPPCMGSAERGRVGLRQGQDDAWKTSCPVG